jgi:hypothetical protein
MKRILIIFTILLVGSLSSSHNFNNDSDSFAAWKPWMGKAKKRLLLVA